MRQKETSIDGFYAKDRIYWQRATQETIFDGTWQLLKWKKDNLLYNIDPNKPEKEWIDELLYKLTWNIADVLCGVNFKKPGKKLFYTDNLELNDKYWAETINVWYLDSYLLIDPLCIIKNTDKKSIWIWWAVADCAWIASSYNWLYPWEIIWLTHAWRTWIKNWVIEQLIDFYKKTLWEEKLKFVDFDISPTAGKNYEWDINIFFKVFNNILNKYNIDPIKENIIEINKDKWFFYLDRIIKRIFLENWVNLEQLNFHKDYTTSFNNSWPSYRVHSLYKKWIFPSEKVIYDARMWVFNLVYKK